MEVSLRNILLWSALIMYFIDYHWLSFKYSENKSTASKIGRILRIVIHAYVLLSIIGIKFV